MFAFIKNRKLNQQNNENPSEFLPHTKRTRVIGILKKLCVIIAVLALTAFACYLYLDYRETTSGYLTAITYRTVDEELDECADFFLSMSKDILGDDYLSVPHRYTYSDQKLYLYTDGECLRDDLCLSIQVKDYIDKITDTLNKHTFSLLWPPFYVCFSEVCISENRLSLVFPYSRSPDSGETVLVYSINGEKLNRLNKLQDYSKFHRVGGNWYNLRTDSNFIDAIKDIVYYSEFNTTEYLKHYEAYNTVADWFYKCGTDFIAKTGSSYCTIENKYESETKNVLIMKNQDETVQEDPVLPEEIQKLIIELRSDGVNILGFTIADNEICIECIYYYKNNNDGQLKHFVKSYDSKKPMMFYNVFFDECYISYRISLNWFRVEMTDSFFF